jgi:hypothetical protein
MRQLDLFLDGREAILVNDLVAALLEGRLGEARDGLDRLGEENPRHPDLTAFDRLISAAREGAPAPPSGGETRPMVEALRLLVPTATRLLGAGAPTFLLPWWQALARTEAVLGAIGDGISIQSTDFRVLYQNQAHKTMVGEHLGE